MTTLPALIPATTTGAIDAGNMPSQADSDHELVAMWIGQSPSHHTRRNYERQSARFLAFVGRPLTSVRVGDVQAYLASLGDVAPATRANATAVVKSLLSFAQLTGFLRFNVGKVIKAPPVKNTLAERILPEAVMLRPV
jgi:site-specific recombinase XerD